MEINKAKAIYLAIRLAIKTHISHTPKCTAFTYYSQSVSYIEAIVESIYSHANIRVEFQILLIEIVKALCRIREYIQLYKLGIKEYMTEKDILLLLTKQLHAHASRNSTTSKLACRMPVLKIVYEMLFIMKPTLFMTAFAFNKSPMILFILYSLLSTAKIFGNNSIDKHLHKQRNSSLLLYLLLPYMWKQYTYSYLGALFMNSKVLIQLMQFLGSYSFII